MMQTPSRTLLLQPADLASLVQLTLAARTGRPATFTPVSLDSSGRVLLVKSVRVL